MGCQSFSFLFLFLVLSARTRNDYENEERGEPVGSFGRGLEPRWDEHWLEAITVGLMS
jgi:hypothetical protein